MKVKSDDDIENPSVRVWLELNGYDGSGAVDVGQPTTMSIRAILPDSIGVRVVNCAALDGIGDASQALLDDRGCPIDEQVFVLPVFYLLNINYTFFDFIIMNLIEKKKQIPHIKMNCFYIVLMHVNELRSIVYKNAIHIKYS